MLKRVKGEDLQKLISRAFEKAFSKDDPDIEKKYHVLVNSISAIVLIHDEKLEQEVKFSFSDEFHTQAQNFRRILKMHAGEHLLPSFSEAENQIIIQVEYDILE